MGSLEVHSRSPNLVLGQRDFWEKVGLSLEARGRCGGGGLKGTQRSSHLPSFIQPSLSPKPPPHPSNWLPESLNAYKLVQIRTPWQSGIREFGIRENRSVQLPLG